MTCFKIMTDFRLHKIQAAPNAKAHRMPDTLTLNTPLLAVLVGLLLSIVLVGLVDMAAVPLPIFIVAANTVLAGNEVEVKYNETCVDVPKTSEPPVLVPTVMPLDAVQLPKNCARPSVGVGMAQKEED